MPPALPFIPLPYDFAALAVKEVGSVLLQSAGPGSRSLLFRKPQKVLQAETLDEVEPLLQALDEAVAQRFYAAGYLAYESGFTFEPKLRPSAPARSDGEAPLAWFGLYEEPTIFDHVTGELSGPDAERLRSMPSQTNDGGDVSIAPQLGIAEDLYAERVEQVRRWIEEGECYQLNLTTALRWQEPRAAAMLFRQLLDAQPVEFGALLQLSDRQILSFSPELFFARDGDTLTTRPMKGTAGRGRTLAEDALQAAWLAADEKNRAENLMIVDLLRNDLGRICRTGTVRVEELFAVERYATLLQMTSTVTGELRAGMGYAEMLRALFPSGSITGAPKIRAMQLLRGLEDSPRGVYTGTIGYIAPNRRACFSVAIRTVELRDGEARMGVGSGIVYDSDPQAEYRECLLKSRFLTQRHEPFELIETMFWDGGFPWLELHMARLRSSAEYFGWHIDLAKIRNQLMTAVSGDQTQRVRMTCDAAGTVRFQTAPFQRDDSPVTVVIASERTDARDVFLHHKTTRRGLYDRSYAEAQAAGYGDTLFLNDEDELTEGCIHSLFLVRDGQWFTPSLSCGVLPGVMRAHLLATRPDAVEARLTLNDLERADAIYLANALRGIRRVSRVDAGSIRKILWEESANVRP